MDDHLLHIQSTPYMVSILPWIGIYLVVLNSLSVVTHLFTWALFISSSEHYSSVYLSTIHLFIWALFIYLSEHIVLLTHFIQAGAGSAFVRYGKGTLVSRLYCVASVDLYSAIAHPQKALPVRGSPRKCFHWAAKRMQGGPLFEAVNESLEEVGATERVNTTDTHTRTRYGIFGLPHYHYALSVWNSRTYFHLKIDTSI